jgi:hypothetical protein
MSDEVSDHISGEHIEKHRITHEETSYHTQAFGPASSSEELSTMGMLLVLVFRFWPAAEKTRLVLVAALL